MLVALAVGQTQAALTALLDAGDTDEAVGSDCLADADGSVDKAALAGLLLLTVQTMHSAMGAVQMQTTQALQALLASLNSADVEWAELSAISIQLPQDSH